MEEINIDNTEVAIPSVEIANKATKTTNKRTKSVESQTPVDSDEPINCLRNERVVVKFVQKENTGIEDKRHPYYGGMAETAIRFFTVPLLSNGALVNVLTKNEKAYLESIMGLEYNALSVYKKEDNYWENFLVRLSKQDTILDLSDPQDYIKYKVLLANKDYIADSLATLRDYPKESYQFVIVSDSEVYSNTATNASLTIQCYDEFSKVNNDFDTLRCIVETISGRPIARNTKIDFLKEQIINMINSDSRRFYNVITDPLLSIKVLIKKAVEKRVISVRGDFYYYRNEPLCGNNENPTFTVAAKFLSAAKNQELKFAIEAETKE